MSGIASNLRQRQSSTVKEPSLTLLERLWFHRLANLIVPTVSDWLRDIALALETSDEIGIHILDAWRIVRYTTGTNLHVEQIACHRYFQMWRERGDTGIGESHPDPGYEVEYAVFCHLFPRSNTDWEVLRRKRCRKESALPAQQQEIVR